MGLVLVVFSVVCYLMLLGSASLFEFYFFCGSVNSSEEVKSIPGNFGATLFLLSSMGFIILKLLQWFSYLGMINLNIIVVCKTLPFLIICDLESTRTDLTTRRV